MYGEKKQETETLGEWKLDAPTANEERADEESHG